MNAVTVDIDFLASLPARALLKLADAASASKRSIERLHRTIMDHPAMFVALDEQTIDYVFSLPDGDINLNFFGDKAKCQAVWVALKEAGYVTDVRAKKGETTLSGYWTKESYSRIFMYFTSTVCRRVQVGTKTVEQPIFETQCDGFPELDVEMVAVPAESSASPGPLDIPF